ncbi:MAG: T9SS type A sorting domain-containing protein [Cyclobacteriaceae bacterium]
MKSIVLIVFLSLSSILAFGQHSTKNQVDGSWTTNSIWTSNSSPGLTSITQDVTIDSYVIASNNSANQGVTFTTNAGLTLNITDTLIVYGDLTFPSNKNDAQVNIGADNLLIVFGNLDMGKNNAGVNVEEGGVVVITGNVVDNGGGGNKINLEGTGNTYVGGTSTDVDPSNAPEGVDGLEEIDDDGFGSIYEFVVNSNGAGTLPITLSEFKAETANTAVNLSWSTLSEENFSYFEVQRAAADGEFDVIATIDGNGWSADERNYTWSDENPRLGINYYRLESVDYDGYRETFKSVAVIFEPTNSEISIGPNPAPLNTPIKLQNTFGEEFMFKLISLSGKTILETSGSDNEIIMPSNMESGIYIVRFEINGLKKTQKLIIK